MAMDYCGKPKMTKQEADYKLSSCPSEHRCGICTYELRVPGTDHYECGIVAGPIEGMMGCKYFETNLLKAANDKITLSLDNQSPTRSKVGMPDH